MSETLTKLSDKEIIQEVLDRGLKDEVLEKISGWDIKEAAEERGYTISEDPDIDDFSDSDLIRECRSRNLGIFSRNPNDDKDQVIEKYYDDFSWPEMNAMFKKARHIKRQGNKLPEDYSMLDNQIIS